MAYAPPTIGAQGLTLPSYTDIRDYLIEQYRAIYGASVYLGNDSSDYEMLSLFALACSDVIQGLQLVYNNRSPVAAIGSALDAIVKLNGIARKVPSYSTCQLTLAGTPGSVIHNGVVQDVAGYKWDLPTPITMGPSGSMTVTTVCETLGAIAASVNAIATIVTPTSGWLSVTNAVEAVPGQPVETDSQLRARQAISTAAPSSTMLAGTIAEVAAVSGVTRYHILENPTGSVDVYGTPAHSLTCVVEGGTDLDVATAIFNNRGIGCLTNGTTSADVTDPTTGDVTSIGFYRPTYNDVYVSLDVHPLSGYTSATSDAIKAAIAAYCNGLQIGELLPLSAAQAAAMAVNPNLSQPMFSIRGFRAKVGVVPGSGDTTDITVNFNEVTTGDVANITVNAV